MAGVAGKSGGARPGAGRKPTRDQYASQVEQAETALAHELPNVVQNLLDLANGESESVKEIWVAAGTIIVEKVLTYDTGQVQVGRSGQPLKGKQSLFPTKSADELVCVRREVTRNGPDRLANFYIGDRIMGKAAAGQSETIELDPDVVKAALDAIKVLVMAQIANPDAKKEVAAQIRGIIDDLCGGD